MSVSAIRPNTSRRNTFSRSKRARRFWSAMAVALRETGSRPEDFVGEEREAARGVSFDPSWRLPAAA